MKCYLNGWNDALSIIVATYSVFFLPVIYSEENGCFPLQTGNHRNGNGSFGCSVDGARNEKCVLPRVRDWGFDRSPLPFHSRSASASASGLNSLWSALEYGLWPPSLNSTLSGAFARTMGNSPKKAMMRKGKKHFISILLAYTAQGISAPVCKGAWESNAPIGQQALWGDFPPQTSLLFACLPLEVDDKLRVANFHLQLKSSLGTPAASMAISGKREDQRGLLSLLRALFGVRSCSRRKEALLLKCLPFQRKASWCLLLSFLKK